MRLFCALRHTINNVGVSLYHTHVTLFSCGRLIGPTIYHSPSNTNDLISDTFLSLSYTYRRELPKPHLIKYVQDVHLFLPT